MLTFSAALPKLREQIEKDLRPPGLSRRKLLATLVQLLDRTLIRVGNDEYTKANRSYGLTTLRQRHAEVEGHTVRFEFKGKSGVPHSVTITDRRLAAIVQQLQDLPGQQLFQFIDEDGKRQSIDSDDVNAYLREVTGLNVTAKDFRTWSGTMLAARALREMGPGAGEREVKRNINRALEQAASRLRNTRSVCRKYYVHPASWMPTSAASRRPRHRSHPPSGNPIPAPHSGMKRSPCSSSFSRRSPDDKAAKPTCRRVIRSVSRKR